MLNFGFLEKGLGIVSLPHFVYDFSRKILLMLSLLYTCEARIETVADKGSKCECMINDAKQERASAGRISCFISASSLHSCFIIFIVWSMKAMCARLCKNLRNEIFKITDKAEAVRRNPVLYDQSHHTFKDKNKNKLAWNDVAKEVDYPAGELFVEKAFLKYNYLYVYPLYNYRFF